MTAVVDARRPSTARLADWPSGRHLARDRRPARRPVRPRTCSPTSASRTGGCRRRAPTPPSASARTSHPLPGQVRVEAPGPHLARLPAPVRGALAGRGAAVVLPRADPLRRHRRPDQRTGRLLHRRLGRGGPAAARRAGAAGPALTVVSDDGERRGLGVGLLARAEAAWAGGDGEAAMAFFGRAADLAEADGDLDARVAAVLGLARGQQYNLTPGCCRSGCTRRTTPRPSRRRGPGSRPHWRAAGPTPTSRVRARPFAIEALRPRRRAGRPGVARRRPGCRARLALGPRRPGPAPGLGGPARRRRGAPRDPDARLQAQLWGLTVAWEVLDLPRMHRCMRAIELLGEESPRARFFAATRRLPLELLRQQLESRRCWWSRPRRPPRRR